MPGGMITVSSTLECPHGGQVEIVPANPKTTAGGATVATVADQFLISGCPFTLPTVPPIPSPCIMVQWVAGDLQNLSNSIPTLNPSSVGLCIGATGAPQGPVLVVNVGTEVEDQ